jgi:hypothetical protein
MEGSRPADPSVWLSFSRAARPWPRASNTARSSSPAEAAAWAKRGSKERSPWIDSGARVRAVARACGRAYWQNTAVQTDVRELRAEVQVRFSAGSRAQCPRRSQTAELHRRRSSERSGARGRHGRKPPRQRHRLGGLVFFDSGAQFPGARLSSGGRGEGWASTGAPVSLTGSPSGFPGPIDAIECSSFRTVAAVR